MMTPSSDHTFDTDLAAVPLALVEFGGTWCSPCHALQKTLDVMARERPDVRFVTVDVDSNPKLMQRYGIRALPTVITFEYGQPKHMLVGNQKRAKLEELLRDRDRTKPSGAARTSPQPV